MYAAAAAKSHQSCPTLCDPIDGRIKQNYSILYEILSICGF